MSDFSQALEKGIYQSGLTENQLAKISGFTRSYIALMKNGQRISPDVEKIKKLLDALTLSPQEYQRIWESYQKARYGDKMYELFQGVIGFLESFGRIPQISIKSGFQHDIPEIRIIHSRMDLEIFLKAVMEEETLLETGQIRLIAQEDFSFLYTLLPSVCRSNSKMRIEHIICLERAEGEAEENSRRNLGILGTLLPVLLAGNENGYQVYCYYDRISSCFASTALMPYLVLTSRYAVNISVDLEYAVVSQAPDTRRLYEMLFIQRKARCRSMLRKIPAGAGLFQYYSQNRWESDSIYILGSQPCFGMLPVDSMVRNYQTEANRDILDELLQVIQKNREMYASARKITSYFTRSGIRRLMETGMVEELPGEISTVLSLPERRRLLQLLIYAVKSGDYEVYLLDEEKVLYPRELQVCAYEMTAVNIVYLSQAAEVRFALEEPSISKALYDFLVGLKNTSYVSDSNEALAFLEAVYVAAGM